MSQVCEKASRIKTPIVMEGVFVFQLVLSLQHHFRLWGIGLLGDTQSLSKFGATSAVALFRKIDHCPGELHDSLPIQIPALYLTAFQAKLQGTSHCIVPAAMITRTGTFLWHANIIMSFLKGPWTLLT